MNAPLRTAPEQSPPLLTCANLTDKCQRVEDRSTSMQALGNYSGFGFDSGSPVYARTALQEDKG